MQQTAAVVDQDLLNNTGSIAPSANNMEILYPVVSTHTMSLKHLDFSTFDGRFRLIIVSHLQLWQDQWKKTYKNNTIIKCIKLYMATTLETISHYSKIFFFTFYGLVMESRKVSNSRSIIKSQRRNAGDGSDSIEI